MAVPAETDLSEDARARVRQERVLTAPFRNAVAEFLIRPRAGTGESAGIARALLAEARRENDRLQALAAEGTCLDAQVAVGRADLGLLCTWIADQVLDEGVRSEIRAFCREAASFQLLPDERFQFTNDWADPNIPVWTGLFSHLRGKPGLAFLELGCFEGRATVWLLENVLTHPSSRIVCVDAFDVHPAQEAFFDTNVAAIGGTHRVEKMKGRTVSVLPTLARRVFEWIYVDADHRATAVLTDAVLSWPLLRRGGTLVFDDYEWDRKLFEPAFLDHPRLAFLSARRGVDAFLAFAQGAAEVVHRGYQIVVKRTV